jgi:UPF0176 protein
MSEHDADQEQIPEYKIAALYHFVTLDDFEALRAPITEFCEARDIKGTLLLANEGINGTVAGPVASIDELISYLKTGNIFKNRFAGLDVKYSYSDEAPFLRMKVRLKKEIVTLRAPEANPNVQVGTYLNPTEWNEIISDPEMVVIDTRNDYEVEIGTFKGAVDPKTKTFTEFKDWVTENLDPQKDKKVAMFCTGGIRCEKASSYMMAHGFEQVYHLKGGILRYLEEQPEEDSLWEGGCFVFDERVAVGHDLVPQDYLLCHACRQPLSVEDRAHPLYELGVQCSYCAETKSDAERERARERQRQMVLAAEKGLAHLGDEATIAAERQRQLKKENKERQRRKKKERQT